ncbi:MAG: hypothetical protein A3K19_18285 [Lentisphaerae bacterium RIFOXYB12_FULL_65_16]|nr:MAG: hypothetical protein A3K18_11115 [Lentisphaerae bacterium RIFOXYA12_64_32]OGV93759.1 MAG: hypothetical protein A3K19_18285 [Lentisphaerae bacterium RIFOXYB12_FULL_65_16]
MRFHSLPRHLALAAAICAVCAGRVEAAEAAIPAAIRLQLGLPPDAELALMPVATSANGGFTDELAKANAPDILAFDACHVGGQRVLLRTTFAQPPVFHGATFIIYCDLDNDVNTGRKDKGNAGVDLMLVFTDQSFGMNLLNPAFSEKNTGARTALVGQTLYVALDAPFKPTGDKLAQRLYLLSERKGTPGDSTPPAVVELPLSALDVPKLPLGKPGSTRPLTDFRYVNDRVAYEKLADKGLRYDQVAPAKPTQFGRPCPEAPFAAVARQPAKSGSVQRQQVQVQLLEEAGVARGPAQLSFGFPLPKGTLFDITRMRLLDGGQEIPAQFTSTAFWPDDSLKWVLVDAAAPLSAKEQRDLAVEFGNEVQRAAPRALLQVRDEPNRITVVTGPVQVAIDKQHFNLLSGVWHDANSDGQFADTEQVLAAAPDGVTLVDEQGKVFTMAAVPPETVKIELQGPERAVVRVAGAYAAADGTTYMRYLARLTFRAGSPRVDVAVTHTNDYLKTEFTDITSLALPLNLPGGVKQATVYVDEGGLKPVHGQALRLFQGDENQSTLKAADTTTPAGQAPGMLRGTGANGAVTVMLQDFWQRWPKGIAADGNQIAFELLPAQPNADYGKDLPYHLMYPFVEGKYRFKWGMAFTERLTFDASGKLAPEELFAEVQMPVIAVLPAEWYAQTGAFGPLAAPVGTQFAMWDKFVDDGFKAYMTAKVQNREYGYFNYGDWFGERGRNWGNNEYDLGHGLFMQFARTGKREYCRWALTAARHEADVDCVQAYPDPYYIGANHQHSIGHMGTWSQVPERATWSFRYDMHTAADGGHTWADGMTDAWCLAGEPRTIESALGLGEHIAWAMAPGFKALGTHERSAGWSLRAIMAVYRATSYDPVYLEAAKRIAAVALSEQKFDQGGAWPHVLPKDHAGDQPGAVGNNLFLLGVLLGGLEAYHQESGDPAALKSLEAATAWLTKSWDEKRCGWPYSATAEGKPLYTPNVSLNQLIISPMAYTGRLTGNTELLEIAAAALTGTLTQGAASFGKSLAQQIFFASETLAELQRWYAATRPDKGLSVLDGSPEVMASLLVKTAASDRYSVRAPNDKFFFVRLRDKDAELTVLRTPHGAMTRAAEFAALTITDAAGKTVFDDKCSTDDKHEFRSALAGEPGAEFKVAINDDQRGVWNLKGEKLDIVTQVVKDYRIGGVGRTRYYFSVPAGVAEFKLRLVGVHNGYYQAVVLKPDGTLAGQFKGTNPGTALIPGAAPAPGPAPTGHPELGELPLTPAAADTGKVWSLILAASGDIGVEMDGVPPYLALAPEAWFEPKP